MGSSTGVDRRRERFILIICLIYSTKLWLNFIAPGFMIRPMSNFDQMLDWTANKPYVTRVLTPLALKSVSLVLPDESQTKIAGSRLGSFLHKGYSILTSDTVVPSRYLVTYGVMLALFWLLFVGTYWYLRLLGRCWFKDSFAAQLTPVGGLLLIQLMMVEGHFLYDPATLFLTTAAAYYLSAKSGLKFYLVFILSVLNKETSILLIPLFALRSLENGQRKIMVKHLFLQTFIFVCVRGAIGHFLQNSPGGNAEFHLWDHNLSRVYFLNKLCSLIFAVCTGYLTCLNWKSKPKFLRGALLVTFVPLFALTMLFGWIDERRDYYEAYPYATVLAMYTLAAFYKLTPEKLQVGESQVIVEAQV